MTKKFGFKFYGGLFVLLLGSALIYFSSLAHGPDFTLHFAREVATKLNPVELERRISQVSNWPEWYYSLDKAEIMDSSPNPNGEPASPVIRTGSQIKLWINPKKGKWKRFQIMAKVVEYLPVERLLIRVLDDSSGKLTKLFDLLEWKIEFIHPSPTGTLIRGTATAHTSHWRSRLFGHLVEKILMNQIFYPDLISLAAEHSRN